MTAFPVLLYHSVGGEPGEYTVSRERFAEHVRAIAASGRTALTVTALAACLRGERTLPDRPLAVTFDDGFADNLEATDLLAEHGVPATVYVTAGSIGQPAMLTPAGVAQLAARDTVEVGAHAVDHLRLDVLRPDQIDAQVAGSRAAVADAAQAPVASFAYPHGAYDHRVRHAVARAGYDSAAAVRNALSHPDDDHLAIARWTVTAGVTAAEVAAVLDHGGGLSPAPRRELIRTRGWRAVRRARHLIGQGARR